MFFNRHFKFWLELFCGFCKKLFALGSVKRQSIYLPNGNCHNKINQVQDKKKDLSNNVMVEWVSRMTSEKVSHSKSMRTFRSNVLDYFNDNNARLNGVFFVFFYDS